MLALGMPETAADNAASASPRPRWATFAAWMLCLASWAVCLGLAYYFLHEDWATTAIGLVVLLAAAAIGWRLDRRIDLAALFKQPPAAK
jgi:hypothetical protein